MSETLFLHAVSLACCCFITTQHLSLNWAVIMAVNSDGDSERPAAGWVLELKSKAFEFQKNPLSTTI